MRQGALEKVPHNHDSKGGKGQSGYPGRPFAPLRRRVLFSDYGSCDLRYRYDFRWLWNIRSRCDVSNPWCRLFFFPFLNLPYEAVALGGNRHQKARRIDAVVQCPADLTHSSVDRRVNIYKDALPPDALENFLARHELSLSLSQQEQQIERNALQVDDAA